MRLTLITPPVAEPVEIIDLKEFLRVKDYNQDDPLLWGLLTAAREYAEVYTGRQLVTATWQVAHQMFPLPREFIRDWPYVYHGIGHYLHHWQRLELPRPNLQSVGSITYTDAATLLPVVLPTSEYEVVASAVPGYVRPVASWPAAAFNVADAVLIQFTTGYGTPEQVPESIKTAIKLLVGCWYENRSPGPVGAGIEQAVHMLLKQHKVESFR